jgi:hypothetical protein
MRKYYVYALKNKKCDVNKMREFIPEEYILSETNDDLSYDVMDGDKRIGTIINTIGKDGNEYYHIIECNDIHLIRKLIIDTQLPFIEESVWYSIPVGDTKVMKHFSDFEVKKYLMERFDIFTSDNGELTVVNSIEF